MKLQVQPTVVLVSMRLDEDVIVRLDPEGTRGASVAGDHDQFGLPYALDVRPSLEFSYEAAKNKLVNLRVGSDVGPRVTFITPGDSIAHGGYGEDIDNDLVGRQGELLRLSGWIDVDSRITVGCAGAILTYLQRRKAVEYLPGDHNASLAFRITTIEMFSLSGTMQASPPSIFLDMLLILSLGSSVLTRCLRYKFYNPNLIRTLTTKGPPELRRDPKKVSRSMGSSTTWHIHRRASTFSGNTSSDQVSTSLSLMSGWTPLGHFSDWTMRRPWKISSRV